MPETTNAQQRSLDLVKEFYAAKERHDLDANPVTFAKLAGLPIG